MLMLLLPVKYRANSGAVSYLNYRILPCIMRTNTHLIFSVRLAG